MARQHDILAAKELVDGQLRNLPPRGATTHRDALAVARAVLHGHGARFRYSGGANEVSFAGVRASSTMDEQAALEGWVRAAYRKLDKRAIERMGR